MTDEELQVKVAELLNAFYAKRLSKLRDISIARICKKNPYLFRAVGVGDASEIVENVLQAFLSSSEETIFGNDFFEPLALAACQTTGGHKSGVKGIDIEVTAAGKHTAYAVKSATNAQNSDAQQKQNDQFVAMQRTLRTSGGLAGKEFDAVIAYSYGRATGAPQGTIYRRSAGQAFWEELTGDSEFYKKIIDAMDDLPDQHRATYTTERNRLKNRLVEEFSLNFLTAEKEIDWNKLVEFNSGKNAPRRLLQVSLVPGTTQQTIVEAPVLDAELTVEPENAETGNIQDAS